MAKALANFFMEYSIKVKDKEMWAEALEVLKTTPAGSDAPPVPDPSTAVKSFGMYYYSKIFRKSTLYKKIL